MKPARLLRLRRFLGGLSEEQLRQPPSSQALHPARLLAHPRDKEFAAFLICLLQAGDAEESRRTSGLLLNRLGPQPALTLVKANRQMLQDLCQDLQLGFIGPLGLALWLAALRNALRRHRSLADLYTTCLGPAGNRPPLVALDRFVVELGYGLSDEECREQRLGHLLPRPAKGSSTARLHLFLRAVCRPDDGADLGLWSLPRPDQLFLPLDQAILDRLRWLKLTEREKPSRGAVLEVTQQLRLLRPADPAFFHHGLERLVQSGLDMEGMRQLFRHA
ncbi:MAG: DUF2400 family protein [Candidatus Delongbacteria bacterium]